MKKLQLILFGIVCLVSWGKAQILGTNSEDKMYKAWKQSKLYVVKTANDEINERLEATAKTVFPNFQSAVTEAEANKMMDNENNFFITVYYPGMYKIKQNTWDKYNFGIGIWQGNAKAIQKIDLEKDMLVRFDFLPVAPNMNLSMVVAVARKAYTETGLDKTFKPEPTIKTMIPSTLIGFKQTLDALDKTNGEKKPATLYKAIAKTLRTEAPILKNKTLLILDNEIMEPFFAAYSLKKEKVAVNDLSKLEAKDKNYCFLVYTIEEKTSIRHVTVIDCETGKIIYQDSGITATTGDKMQKKYADNMEMAANGKSWD
jgi:hypothetical protein